MTKIYTLFLFFSCVISSEIFNQLFEHPDQVEYKCLKNIINNQNEQTMTMLISGFTRRLAINHLNAPVLRIDHNQHNLLQNSGNFYKNFIIEYENRGILNITLGIMQTMPGYTKFKLYILVNFDKTRINLPNTMDYLWKLKFFNFVFLVKNKNSTELYRIDYDNWGCGTKINHIAIGMCIDNLNKTLFTGSTIHKYFIQCPFRVIWSIVAPWVFNAKNSNPGVSIEILNLFERASKFNLVYMPENSIYMDELSEGYRFDRLLQDFSTGYADVYAGLASYFGSIPVEKTFILDSRLYFAMPKPRKLSYWKTFQILFNWKYCTLIGITIVILSFPMALLSTNSIDARLFGSFRMNLYYGYAITLGMGIHKAPATTKLRILVWFFAFNAIIQIAVFQGKLYSFLSKPLYEKPIGNLEELIEANIPIKFIDGMRILFMDDNPTNKEVLRRASSSVGDGFVDYAYDAFYNSSATIIDEGALILQPNLKQVLQMFEIHSFIMCYYMPKNHVLYEYFDDTIRRIIENGFLDKIISEMKFYYSNKGYIHEKQEQSRVSLKQLQMAFVLLLLGNSVAVIVFAVELLVKKIMIK